MRKRRRFYRGKVNHVYQRTVNWVNIFYSNEDFLVFYTIFSVCAKSANIIVLELCIMFDHIHFLAIAENIQELSSFVDRFASWFVKEYNAHTRRKGKLFYKNFGSAPKWSEKDVRSAINYVGNNPVEKLLCRRAREYRWNFLAYFNNENPFSEKYVASKASRHLRNAIKEASELAKLNLPLRYCHLKRMMSKLSKREKDIFIDKVIVSYLPFDYEQLVSYYESYENMLTAIDSNTGSEHDIKERNDKSSHIVFQEMIESLSMEMATIDLSRIISLPIVQKMALKQKLKTKHSVSDWQMNKFLHILDEECGT